jgi:hypothetical protein
MSDERMLSGCCGDLVGLHAPILWKVDLAANTWRGLQQCDLDIALARSEETPAAMVFCSQENGGRSVTI